MTAPTRYQKVSWTIESDVLDQVKERVPRGQQSAYATEALRRQLERDNLTELVGELIEANGPLDDEVVRRHMEELR